VQTVFDPLAGFASSAPAPRPAVPAAPAPVSAPAPMLPQQTPLLASFGGPAPITNPNIGMSAFAPAPQMKPSPYGVAPVGTGLGAFNPAPSAFLPASSFQPSAPAAQAPSVFDSRPAGTRSGSGSGSKHGGASGFEFMKQRDAFGFVAEEVGKSMK
jgi:hypothetical protein